MYKRTITGLASKDKTLLTSRLVLEAADRLLQVLALASRQPTSIAWG